ncbi:MAG: hypothetical protein AAGC47_01125 [Bacteroidota bacterium]
MSTLRFFLVSVISFLILGPLVRYLDIEIEPPIIAVLADNSTSIAMGSDSSSVQAKFNDAIAKIQNSFGDHYEITTYTFGSDLSQDSELTFSEPITDFSNAFAALNDRYTNRNLGAVVLLSDGIYNRGANPRYSAANLKAPVYSIAFGDTTLKRDARIAETAANRIAFLGNSFPIEVRIEADRLTGTQANLSIFKDGQSVFDQTIEYTKENFSTSVRAILDADQPGLQQYVIRLQEVDQESTTVNNSTSVFIDVLDDRQKILVLANSPHPDLKAIREAVISNENYEADVELASNFSGELKDYDLIILHQLPSVVASSRSIIEEIDQLDLPILIIVGGQTNLNSLSDLGGGIVFNGRSKSSNDVKGTLSKGFSLFKIEDSVNELVKNAPPLKVPFGEWTLANSAEPMLKQRVGRIDTDDDLLVVNTIVGRKAATLIGEGIWRWRLSDYALNENHDVFDSFFTSLIQYLAVKEDKRLFRVNGPELAMENEELVFQAELYNASYEPINDVDVELVITGIEGEEYPYFFTRTAEAYRIDIGTLPPGNYTYLASVLKNGERLSDSGTFGVKPFALESARLRADFQTLNLISSNSGGELYYPAQVDELINQLEQGNERLKPVSFSTEIFDSLLNFRWLFIVLLILLSGEWFLRKYLGRY